MGLLKDIEDNPDQGVEFKIYKDSTEPLATTRQIIINNRNYEIHEDVALLIELISKEKDYYKQLTQN